MIVFGYINEEQEQREKGEVMVYVLEGCETFQLLDARGEVLDAFVPDFID